MGRAIESPHLLRFGIFELDLDGVELRKDGRRVRLQGQPLQLLAELAKRPTEVVTREELRRKLWPPETFVDFENSLNIAVNKLRQALGDSAENPVFIQTLPRLGYRFLAPVEALGSDPVQVPGNGPPEMVEFSLLPGTSPSASNAGTSPSTRPSRRTLAFAVSALLVILLGGLILTLNVFRTRGKLFSRSSTGRIGSLAVLPLESISADLAQDYVADGMTEELIAELAQNTTLRVTSRTSVMQYKGTRKTVPQIAKELNVDAVVEGAVIHAGQRVRVLVKLVRAKDDRHLWTGRYEREVVDILTLRAELARSIAGEIQTRLTP